MRPPEFTWVRPTTLLVDETYQRGISSRSIKLIGRIVANWDWARFKPPVVAVTAGGLEVIDGQHTAIAAASHGGIAEIPVMIVGAPDMADRARSFIGHNLDRVAITPAQLHAANIAGANPDALVVERVCRAAGVNLLKRQPNCDGYNVNDCQAYQRVYRLVINRGPGAATTILKTLADARRKPIADYEIAAVEALLHDPEYAGTLTPAQITGVIDGFGEGLRREADIFAAAHRVTRAKAAAIVIFRKGTHGKHRVSK